MKCAAIFIALSFVVLAGAQELPANLQFSSFDEIPQSVLENLSSQQIEQIKLALGGGGGGGTEIRGGGGEGGVREIRGGGGGGGDGGPREIRTGGGGGEGRVHRVTGKTVRRVHRIPGERRQRVHRVTGQLVTNKHSFRISGEGGAEGPPQLPQGGGEPKGPKGPSRPAGPGPKGPSPPTGPAPGALGSSVRVSGLKKGKRGKTTCRNSGLTALADKLNIGLQDLVNKIANVAGANTPGKPGLLGHVFGGAQTALDNTLGGLDQGVSDFFCGFNRVFNKIGSQIHQGHLLNGVLSGLNVFVSGAGSFFGNLGTNGIGAITSGVSDLVHGRRGKPPNKIVHSHHGDLTDVIRPQ